MVIFLGVEIDREYVKLSNALEPLVMASPGVEREELIPYRHTRPTENMFDNSGWRDEGKKVHISSIRDLVRKAPLSLATEIRFDT